MADELRKFAKLYQNYVNKDIKRAAVTAINKALVSTRVLAAKGASEATGGKQADLKRKMGIFKATFKRPSGAMISFSEPISLSAFTPRSRFIDTRRGIRAAISVKGPEGRYTVPQASMATYASGRTSVFTRLKTNKSKDIKNLYTNALIKYMAQPGLIKTLEAKAVADFEKYFRHEVEYQTKLQTEK